LYPLKRDRLKEVIETGRRRQAMRSEMLRDVPRGNMIAVSARFSPPQFVRSEKANMFFNLCRGWCLLK